MPVITMQSLPLTDEQRSTLAEAFSRTVSEVTHVPEDKIYVFFSEHALNCTAKGGKLFSEAPPQFGKGNFQ
jgi:phenylpyruvate tautomerase PptA (4-oxalocrotonate tautomerase family)